LHLDNHPVTPQTAPQGCPPVCQAGSTPLDRSRPLPKGRPIGPSSPTRRRRFEGRAAGKAPRRWHLTPNGPGPRHQAPLVDRTPPAKLEVIVRAEVDRTRGSVRRRGLCTESRRVAPCERGGGGEAEMQG